jgi:hypothetical protein
VEDLGILEAFGSFLGVDLGNLGNWLKLSLKVWKILEGFWKILESLECYILGNFLGRFWKISWKFLGIF